MRTRLLGSTIAAVLLSLLIGVPLALAQMSDLSKPDRFWDNRITVGLPGDDEGDDENDDEVFAIQRIFVATAEEVLPDRQPWGMFFACVSAECAEGEIAIGGGFSALPSSATEANFPPPGTVVPCAIFACGFEVLYNGPGPHDPLDQAVNGRIPASREWMVCGQSPEEAVLQVYAICTSAHLPICGDGRVGSGEECESDYDCGGGTCDDCLCSGYCGDGVFDPLTEGCETDSDCPYHPQDVYFCRDCQCIVHGGGD
jgi:hypothetical protein